MTVKSSRSNRTIDGQEDQSNTNTDFRLKHGVGVFMAAILAAQVGYATEVTNQHKPKIYNGTDTFTQTTPWMVQVKKNTRDGYEGNCGGTLIAKNWVLTAAHCVLKDGLPWPKNTVRVVIKNSRRDFINGAMQTVEDPIEVISAEEIYPHPDFNYDRQTSPNGEIVLKPLPSNNDIALIKLSQPSTATPLELFPLHDDWKGNFDADPNNEINLGMALGWGVSNTDKNGKETLPANLQKVDLPIVSNKLCESKFGKGNITNNMLCVGYPNGEQSTCPGDSGGPLVIFDQGSETWHQVGLTSFGVDKPCGNRSYSVFTRVENYKKDIAKAICTDDAVPSKPIVSKFITQAVEPITEITVRKGGIVRLSWTRPDEDTKYLLKVTDNNTKSELTPIELNDQDEYISPFLPKGGNYTATITAYKGICTATSDSLNVPIE